MHRLIALMFLSSLAISAQAQQESVDLAKLVPAHSWCGWSQRLQARFRLTFSSGLTGGVAKYSSYGKKDGDSVSPMSGGPYVFSNDAIIIYIGGQGRSTSIKHVDTQADGRIRLIDSSNHYMVQCDDGAPLAFPAAY